MSKITTSMKNGVLQLWVPRNNGTEDRVDTVTGKAYNFLPLEEGGGCTNHHGDFKYYTQEEIKELLLQVE